MLPSARISSSFSRLIAVSFLTKFRYSCSPTVKFTLIGSTVETVVTGSLAGLTRLPNCVCATPAIPSIGEVSRVNSRLTFALSSVALAASTAAPAASI